MFVLCYLELLLARPHVDVSAPDDESLAAVLLTGYGSISRGLEHTHSVMITMRA